MTSTVPNSAASLSKTARSFGSLLGSCLSKTFLPTGVRPCPWWALLRDQLVVVTLSSGRSGTERYWDMELGLLCVWMRCAAAVASSQRVWTT